MSSGAVRHRSRSVHAAEALQFPHFPQQLTVSRFAANVEVGELPPLALR